MTNGWVDIKNADMMLIMGGNPAENHPCGFKWAIEAKRNRNAKMIVVDPRFTRTAATADLFVQIRAGADIAFLGGVIRYAIENNRIAKDYLVNYTNASFIVKEGFKLPEDGLYSGFDAATQTYDKSTWNYEAAGGGGGEAKPGLPANVNSDLALQHPRCVFQLLKTAVFALHAGDGGAYYRHTERSIPEGRGPVHFHPQRRRHEKGRDHHVCGGLDAAHLRHADYPDGGHAAVAAGKCGTRGRRRECAARPFQYPGRYRYGRRVRYLAGISEGSERQPMPA